MTYIIKLFAASTVPPRWRACLDGGAGFGCYFPGVGAVVVLQRIEPGEPAPPYCVHGRTTCVGGCGEWLWLGSATLEVVTSGEALPLCQECASALIGPQASLVRRVRDHRISEGPH